MHYYPLNLRRNRNFYPGLLPSDILFQLLRFTGDLKRESVHARIHHPRAEDLGFLENGAAAFHRGANAQQNHFAEDGGGVRKIRGLQDVDELVHLLDDLGAEVGIDVDDDGHAGERGIERARDCQALDVVPAGAEHSGDAHEGAGLVLD